MKITAPIIFLLYQMNKKVALELHINRETRLSVVIAPLRLIVSELNIRDYIKIKSYLLIKFT